MITAKSMIQAIKKIESREMLNGIIVSNFPNLNESEKRSVIRNLENQAEIKTTKVSKEVSNQELNEWLKGIFNG